MLNFDGMKKQRFFTLLYIYVMVIGMLKAQSVAFYQYTAADGLSDNNVLCGLRDRYGFMWLGTNNGLNCFDGTQNQIFRNMVEENSSFENNTITALYENGDDIWFGGSFGLYVYHRATNSFSRFDKKTAYGVTISATVQDIVGASNGLIWIGTQGQGLFIYNTQTDQLTQDSRHGAFISDILAVDDSPVFIATLQGNILLFSQKGEYMLEHPILNYQSDKNNLCLELIGFNLYIGCERGLYTILRGENDVHRVSGVNLGIHSIKKKGRELLLGTDQGIYLYNPSQDKLSRFDNPSNKTNGLSDTKVNNLLWDKDSTLWVMTQMGGVCYMPASRNDVILTSLTDGSNTSMINTICEENNGNLWVGTEKGLYLYDAVSHQYTPYPNLRYEINALTIDGSDLWIGTRHDGIIVLNTLSGATRHYQYSANRSYTIPSNEITSILRTSSGTIYVGTSWGLCRFERKSENFMWYFGIGSMTHVTCLVEDKQGCVWAATSNHGLFKEPRPGESFDNFTYHHNQPNSILSNNVSTVFCDHEGKIWVAYSGSGLSRFDAESQGFEHIGADNSDIQEQQIYFIAEDMSHNLWIGIETGLLKLNADRSVDHIEVLPPHNDMDRMSKPHNSVCLARTGELFASISNILIQFSPSNVKMQSKKNAVYIVSITLPYKSSESATSDDSSHRWPLNDGNITLPYSDNSFTLHFSQPSYHGTDKHKRYEYMMEGIDNTWAKGTKNAEATFNNLPPGSYVFVLREAGNTNTEQYARLQITILPPWYRTNTAYFFYFLLIAAILFMGQRRYSEKLRRRYNRRMKEYQAEQEKNNFESKIRFFINLVHEIRTPLTLMSLPLETISDEIGNNKHIAAIRRNMNYLLGITNQLLDFQKAENGHMQINMVACNVGNLLTHVYEQFSDAMEVQNKHIQLQLPEQPITTTLDIDKVQKVMMNLVSNATKYAKSEIIIRLEQTSLDALCISVIDDGPGVPVGEREKIFDLYYQIGNDDVASTLGTGLGLSYAKMLAQAHHGDLKVSDSVGGGSNFQLILPITNTDNQPVTDHSEANSLQELSGTIVDNSTEDDGVYGKRDYRILLVEDNEELLQMASDAMKSYFHIVKARDGKEALKMLQKFDIDVIVSDVMMPNMDGTELCRRVKEDINYSHIPVILLTAKTSVEAKLEGMQSGADIYLEKPFSSKQLYLQVMSLLRMRQQFYERMRNIDGFNATEENNDLGMNQQDMLFLERLKQMVDENMRDEDFSIDILAEQMNMSRSSFYRKVKALTDMTPIEYLKERRLEQSAVYLRKGDRITEVAERVGFTSSSYFAKCFKAKYGSLPKDYQTNYLASKEQE